MKVLLTGSSGFFGKHVLKELSDKAEIITMSRTGSDINVDIIEEVPKLPEVDLVIHSAGKAHMLPKDESEKKAFFDVNLAGTSNLLKALELAVVLPKYFVFISSVAVYGCEYGLMINENHELKAKDPYGLSKIQAEKLIAHWCEKHNIICGILRLPLLVGANPPGNLGAMIKGIRKGYYFNIAEGRARKSMVLASDVAKIIPLVAEIGGTYNLTDGHHPSFNELSQTIARKLNKATPINIPLWIAKLMAKFGNLLGDKAPINSRKLRKINSDLTFDDSKAKKLLSWNPSPVLKELNL